MIGVVKTSLKGLIGVEASSCEVVRLSERLRGRQRPALLQVDDERAGVSGLSLDMTQMHLL